MSTQEIFDRLMALRRNTHLGDNQVLDEYFNAVMYDVAKYLGLPAEQMAQVGGDVVAQAGSERNPSVTAAQ